MKKALSILLSGILLMAVITAIPFTASAATDRVIDLSKSELLVAGDKTNMTYDAEGATLKLSIQQWYGANKPISAVGDTSTWCKEIGLKYADGNWAWLESGKRYAVTLFLIITGMEVIHSICRRLLSVMTITDQQPLKVHFM